MDTEYYRFYEVLLTSLPTPKYRKLTCYVPVPVLIPMYSPAYKATFYPYCTLYKLILPKDLGQLVNPRPQNNTGKKTDM